MRRTILSILAVLPASCVSLSGEPCSPDEWRLAGLEDGAEGLPQEARSERWAKCEKKARGAAPDLASYLGGWRQGRDDYCVPASGFSTGARGADYANICEGAAEEGFLAAYAKGRRLFDLQASLIRADQAMSRAQTRLWETRRRISELETAIILAATPHEERVEMTAELRSLRQESRRAEFSLVGLAEDKARAARDLEQFRSALVAESGALRPSNTSF